MMAIKKGKKKETVCIVGCSDSKTMAPLEKQDEYEFWGVNNLFLTMPGPWSRWFEIHSITKDGDQWLRRGDSAFRGQTVEKYLKGLAGLDCPVYMQQKNPLVPNSVMYPMQEIVEKFGTYFTNTISWEIALAISEGFKEIKIYGIDMAVDSEYTHQRPSVEFFLGIALGRGIKVSIPPNSDLLKTRFLYGFQDVQELEWTTRIKLTLKSLNERRDKYEDEMKLNERKVYESNGAIAGIQEMLKTWKNVTGG
jgi:hypothetical protein